MQVSESLPSEQELAHLHSQCREEFAFALSPEDFVAFLAKRASSMTEIHQLAVVDLYLACACARQLPEGIEHFKRRYGPEIRQVVRQLPDALAHSDEIEQEIMAFLLVKGPSGAAGVDSYLGKGSLFSWLRIIAIRRAFRLLAQMGREVEVDEERLVDSMAAGPELQYMKELYRDSFRSAFSAALLHLRHEDRSFLRQHYVHGLSIDKLSRLHSIHRATAARRLAKIRDDLLQSTRRSLLHELRITSEELNSIMRLIASNLEASMGGLMESSEAEN